MELFKNPLNPLPLERDLMILKAIRGTRFFVTRLALKCLTSIDYEVFELPLLLGEYVQTRMHETFEVRKKKKG